MEKHDKRAETWIDDGEFRVESDELTGLLDEVYSKGPGEDDSMQALDRVASALKELADEAIYYDVIPATPVGPVYVAMSERGVVALGFDESEGAFLQRMRKRFRSRFKRSSEQVSQVTGQLHEYFSGRRTRFELEVDLRSLTAFQRLVLEAIRQVPAGKTISYGGLARSIGKPKAARAVGQALGSNPIPIIIPCHRALAAGGGLGGYSGRGGVRTKQALLVLEGARE